MSEILCAVPRNREDVSDAIARIAELLKARGLVELLLAGRISDARALQQPVIEELTRSIDALSNAVQGWCQAHKEELVCDGENKATFSAGEIVWRGTPMAVKCEDEDAAVEYLWNAKLRQYVRIKKSLDKRKLLSEREKIAEKVAQVLTFKKGENFIIKPHGSQAEVLLPVAQAPG